jgi:hypothetical protein
MNDNRQTRLQSLSGGLRAETNKANVCHLYESARPKDMPKTIEAVGQAQASRDIEAVPENSQSSA